MTTPSKYIMQLVADIGRKTQMKSIFDKKALDSIGETTVAQMRADIARGMSPIAGEGKFPAYKNPKKYPGKRKPRRPVNLLLTGSFQKALTYRTNASKLLIIILYKGRKEQLKELGHREGANRQPQRATIPLAEREQFNPAIRKKIQRVINEILRRASATWKT